MRLQGFEFLVLITVLVIVTPVVIAILRSRKARKGQPKKKASGAVTTVRVGLGLLPFGLLAIGGFGFEWALVVSALGLVILIFGLCGLIADMAKGKGRSWAAFFWLSILFTPILMWIIAATISPLPGSETYRPIDVAANIPRSEPDHAQQISALGALKDQGLITADEFENKKKEILERM